MAMTNHATAHAAASRTSQELAGWNPPSRSADAAWLPERDAVTARVQDIARNNGWISGALQSHVDQVIGASFRFRYRPDWKSLGLSADWAFEFRQKVESRFNTWANDPRFYCDAAERQTLSGLLGLAFRHRLGDGEALALAQWLPRGDSPWATAIQMIDPDRLSNPPGRFDDDTIRGGVEINPFGAPQAYHIRCRHPADVAMSRVNGWQWMRVPRREAWGRSRVIHFFEPDRAGQTRGKSLLAPILDSIKMEDRWRKTEMAAALVNAIFAAFIESPFDTSLLGDALGQSSSYQEGRLAFHQDSRINVDGVRLQHLYPGETFKFSTPSRPNAAFGEFERAVLRNMASALGTTYEQLARDWSQTNYSSARAALLETWKWMLARREHFATGFAIQIFALWMEEEFERGDLDIPAAAPGFWEAFPSWVRGRWIGPGRGWVDPVKEANAAALRVDYQLSNLEDEAAEQGRDIEENFEQLAYENRLRRRYGLPDPAVAAVANHAAAAPTSPDSGSEPGSGNGDGTEPGNVADRLDAHVARMARLGVLAAGRAVRPEDRKDA